MNRWRRHAFLSGLVTAALFLPGCPKKSQDVVTLRHYPIGSIEGVLAKSGVAFDPEISSDGGGSLRVTADRPRQVPLFETGEVDVENARLLYQAKVRTENVEGKAYLEMWCSFPGKGEFFSRSLQTPLSGSTSWTSQETPFFLKKGENPDNVKLNLVIDGTGTVWIDDIRLTRGPLH